MTSAARPTRPSLLVRYAIIFSVLGVYAALVVLGLMFGWLGRWSHWLLGPITGAGAIWLTWRLVNDTQERVAWKKAVLWWLGSGMLLVLVQVFACLAAGRVNPFSAVSVVSEVLFVSVWVFVGLLGLARLVLKLPWAPLSVARSVLDEAVSLRVVVGLFALLLLLVPMLPFLLAEDQPLRYRVQQFLGYSMGAMTFILAVFTLIFACWTLANEVRDKQVFTTLVKPIGRAQYLLGKWLGIVLLDAILLSVAGVGIVGFTQFYLAKLPAQDRYDRLAVQEEVLTARVKAEPRPAQPFAEKVEQRIAELLRERPEQLIEMGRAAAAERGRVELSRDALLERGVQRAHEQLLGQERTAWRSLGPVNTQAYAQVYVFDHLDRAAEYGDVIYLRYKIKGATGSKTPLAMDINGYRFQIEAPINITQRQPIPVDIVDAEGRVNVVIYNRSPNQSITFPVEDGLAMLYKVGRFGPNFARAMALTWLKLAFLAALGLTMATFLGFAVAMLGGLLVSVGVFVSGYVLDSLSGFGGKIEAAVDYLSVFLKWIGWAFTKPLAMFSEYQPIGHVVDGLYLEPAQVLSALFWIGLIWTGGSLLIGWLIFRGRELARVQV